MYDLVSKLIIYRSIGEDSILMQLAEIWRDYGDVRSLRQSGEIEESDWQMVKRDFASRILTQINRLLDVATTYGFNDNLWHNYLAYLLATTLTPFTLVSEKVGAQDGSVNFFAKNDFRVFKSLFDYDFRPMEQELDLNCFSVIGSYKAVVKKERIYNESVSSKVRELSLLIEQAKDEDQVFDVVTDFYKRYGVGKLGLNKAFRVAEHEGIINERPYAEGAESVPGLTGAEGDRTYDGSILIPITNTSDVVLEDLVGYEIQKQKLIENTEAFIRGRRANNVLLYGDAGTGKSTSVKAILNRYYPDGLRLIEIYKHQFKDLSRIITEIKNRNYRFIIYMDDLSFEEFETDYKYLKAVIEGGVEPYPENVLIYATSNRRHLIRETWTDRYDESRDDKHRNDTVQEKLSLSGRFGLTIGYFAPTPQEYDEIVRQLAARHPEIKMSEEELRKQGHAWELRHGGYSGRAAQQFINYLSGTVYADE